MSRYTFDVHDDGPAHWADDSRECGSRGDIELFARRLLNEAHTRQADRDSFGEITTVMVLRECGGVVLNAHAKRGGHVNITWASR
jgi:hypothetical protein